MRKGVIVLIVVCLLVSCGRKTDTNYETVNDILYVCAIEDAPYGISVLLPDGTIADCFDDGGIIYEAENGEYTISTRILCSDGFDSVLYELSGYAQPHVLFHARNQGQSWCQAAWCSAGEQGEMICRAKVCHAGAYYYAVCFSLRKGMGREYNACMNRVFCSFTLKKPASQKTDVFSEDIAEY